MMQESRPAVVSERAKDGELIVLRVLQIVLTICGSFLRYLRILLF
jgi:hypothetical protein